MPVHGDTQRFIPIYSPAEIDAIDAAARVAMDILARLTAQAVPGVTTHELDALATESIAAAGAAPLFLGVKEHAGPAYPGVTCISVNDDVVHGIPDGRVLEAGDEVTIDVGLRLAGFCADVAEPITVGRSEPDDVAAAARRVTDAVIGGIRPERPWSEIARVAKSTAESLGFGLVEGFGGHGIGAGLHEKPPAGFDPAHRDAAPENDWIVRPGMVFTVEPIIAERPARGGYRRELARDGWTMRLSGGEPSAYRERVVAVTTGGVRILGG